MNFPSELKHALTDNLAPAARRLLDAIVMHVSETPGDATRFSASKSAVITELAKLEDPVPDNTALRQRLQTIRNLVACDEAFQVDGVPCFHIESTKAAYVWTWADGALKTLSRSRTRSTVVSGGHDDYMINVGNVDPIAPEFQLLQRFEVLVSHNWEDNAADSILDDFVKELETKLRKLPTKYVEQMTVDLLYDRSGAMHGRSGFNDQMDDLCERSTMAIFMTSNGWIGSQACQHEAAHFVARANVKKQRPFLCVQLCDQRSELPEEYSRYPNYPALAAKEFPGLGNLLELWEQPMSVKDKFVARIRDEVCEFLLSIIESTPPPAGGRPKTCDGNALKQWVARRQPSSDPGQDKAVLGHMTPEFGDDRNDVDTGRLPAVDTLNDWAIDDSAESRLLVLLGGFGMGKTTTVQMLHERLRETMSDNPAIPTPIYLDFRRLIPRTQPGRAVEGTLADLIVTALHSVAGEQISGDDIIDLIRNDNCVVIFDGLDEVGNRIGRDYAAQLYRQFLELIPAEVQAAEAKSGKADWSQCKTRLILTCRTHFFRSLREQKSLLQGAHRRVSALAIHEAANQVPGVATFYMAPLRLEQISELFENHLGEELGNQTFNLIRGIHDLPGLARRPILARFISEVAGELVGLHKAGKTINIATVYRELFLQTMERDAEKQPLLKPRDRSDLLTALAAHLHDNGLGPQSADELETWFDRFAREHNGLALILGSGNVSARNLLHTELENASFLVRGGDDRFSFAHTSYFEYFLAIALVNSADDEALHALTAQSINDETRSFIASIAERDSIERETRDRWIRLLRSDAPRRTRYFAYSMLNDGGDFRMPSGANLSGFDLRNARLSGPEEWLSIDLTDTQLNAADIRNIVFRNCLFDGTNLANSCFENSHFVQPTGVPKGLRSARGSDTDLPEPWTRSLSDRSRCWTNQQDYIGHRVLLNTVFSSVAISRDGARLLTGSDDKTARLWDASSGDELLRLEGHSRAVTSVAISRDGTRLFTGSGDRTARLWDASSGEELLRLDGHRGYVSSVAISRDGTRLLTGSRDQTARLWDASSGEELLRLDGHQGFVNSVAMSRDGNRLLTGSRDGVHLWDASSGQDLLRLERRIGSYFQCVAISRDGTRLLTGSDDNTACLWDASSGQALLRLDGHSGSVLSVAVSRDGTRLLTGSDDNTARLWDASSGQELQRLDGHSDPVVSVAISRDGTRLLTGSVDSTARLWDASSGQELLRLEGHSGSVLSVAISRDFTRLFTGSGDQTAYLWDLSSGQELLRLDYVSSVAISRDGTRLFTGSDDNTARLWDASSGQELQRLDGHSDPVVSVAISRDGTRLLTGSVDSTARLWDASSGQELLRLEGHSGSVRSVAISRDVTRLLTVSRDGVHLWDASSGEELLRLNERSGYFQCVAISCDFTRLLTGSVDSTARLWDASSGQELLCIDRHSGPVSSVAISRDGTRLLTGSVDSTARLWDASSGQALLRLDGHSGSVLSVAISRDGTRLLTGSGDSTARLWDASSGEELLRLVGLPESWAALDTDSKVIKHGSSFWRYAA